jgi:hypothetical protein
MLSIVRLFPRRQLLAWTFVLLTGSLHLFVGLSNYYPNVRRGWLTDARVGSHDGDVLAGAFLYNSFVQNPIGSIRHTTARSQMPVERSYMTAVRELQSGRHRGERIHLVFAGGEGHAIHYFIYAANARVVDRQTHYRITDPVTYDVGGARLTATGIYKLEEPGAPAAPVAPGDAVWLLNRSPGDVPDTEARVAAHLPPGLTLSQRTRLADAPMLWTYRVQGKDGDTTP